MKRDARKFLGIFLVSVLFLSVIIGAIGFVGAADIKEKLGIIAGTFSDFFSKTGWEGGQLSTSVAKVIFFVIISLLIYLIIYSTLGEKHNNLIAIISFLIGFLTTAYITPQEVFSLLNSYTALGLTLITLVPLIILGFITYFAAVKGTPFDIIQYFGWILFAVYSLYRLVSGWSEGNAAVNWILLATAIISAGVVLFNKTIRRIITKNYLNSIKDSAERETVLAALGLKTLAEFEKMAAGKSPIVDQFGNNF